jgi:uncharacterized damage-inducible protein DinB
MQQYLDSITQFNKWANQQLAAQILLLNHQDVHQQIEGSFDSIHKTWHHIYVAENIWNQRLLDINNIDIPKHDAALSMLALHQNLIAESNKLCEYVNNVSGTHWWLQTITYNGPNNVICTNAKWQTITHVCNHGSFHRGQLVNFLRHLGITTITNTDFMGWVRAQ